jgi:hypothetical protein
MHAYKRASLGIIRAPMNLRDPALPLATPPFRRRWLALALVLAALFSVPTLRDGFFADDYALILMLEGRMRHDYPRVDLYHFTDGSGDAVRESIEHGLMPWFSAPHLKIAFCRPLGGALLMADHALFGRSAVGYHAHTILWYLALCAVVALLYRRTLPAGAAALAACLFAVNDSHAVTIEWIANRHSTVSALFASLGLLAHLRARERGWRAGVPLSLGAIGVGLAAGETALGALGYIVAYELVARPEPLRRRLAALIPVGSLTLAYLLLYKALGYGTRGSGSYIDPFGQPRRFLANAAERALVLIGGFLGGPPADYTLAHPQMKPVLIAIAVVLLTVFALMLRQLRLEPGPARHARWLAIGALMSLLPTLGGFPGIRLLLLPSIGGVAVTSLLIWRAFTAWRKRGGLGWKIALPVLVLFEVVRPPLFLGVMVSGYRKVAQENLRISSEAEWPSSPDTRVVVLNASDLLVSLYTNSVRIAETGVAQGAWWVLSSAPLDHVVSRLSADTLELDTVDGTMLAGPYEQLFRAPDLLLPAGASVQLGGLEVRVLADQEGRPTRLAAKFDRPLDDPSLWFMTFRDGQLRHVVLPPAGTTLRLPWTRGPLEQ